VVKADPALAEEIFRAVRTRVAEAGGREVVIRVHPELAAYLDGDGREGVQKLAAMLDVKVTVQQASGRVGREEYELQVR
jgi:hypothetical protein